MKDSPDVLVPVAARNGLGLLVPTTTAHDQSNLLCLCGCSDLDYRLGGRMFFSYVRRRAGRMTFCRDCVDLWLALRMPASLLVFDSQGVKHIGNPGHPLIGVYLEA